MQDGMLRAADRSAASAVGGVSQFATEVVARLVARDGTGSVEPRDSLVSRFMDAVRSSDPAAFEALKPELKRARISAATLAEVYIPEVARRLGQGWDDDCISFAEVTMGVARLQAILREIGTTWVADEATVVSSATVLMVLPSGEQHTLGALCAAGWLRRRGISVCLRIAPTTADLADLLASRSFDGAMISIACEDKVDVCAMLVQTLRDHSVNDMRVAVGGAITALGDDALKATGADIVTNDLAAAALALNLKRQTMVPLCAT
jgi:methylmalonyl-CoA mutase cobalamin-binding subunit